MGPDWPEGQHGILNVLLVVIVCVVGGSRR